MCWRLANAFHVEIAAETRKPQRATIQGTACLVTDRESSVSARTHHRDAFLVKNVSSAVSESDNQNLNATYDSSANQKQLQVIEVYWCHVRQTKQGRHNFWMRVGRETAYYV